MNLKRTREKELLAIGCIKAGGTLTEAAAIAGISYFSLIRWKSKGAQPDASEDEVRFTKEMEEARSWACKHK
jgi:hypothetical protein